MNIFSEIKMMGNYRHLRRARKALALRVIKGVAALIPFFILLIPFIIIYGVVFALLAVLNFVVSAMDDIMYFYDTKIVEPITNNEKNSKRVDRFRNISYRYRVHLRRYKQGRVITKKSELDEIWHRNVENPQVRE